MNVKKNTTNPMLDFLKKPISDKMRKKYKRKFGFVFPEGAIYADALAARWPDKHVKEKLKL